MLDVATAPAVNRWEALADKALAGEELTRGEALSVLSCDDDQLLALLHAAFRVRRAHYGRKVKLNMLVNAKSGICPEDCGYCSQSIVSTADVPKYQMLSRETLVEGAREAWARRAGTYCIVASGRRPSRRELAEVTAAVREIKQELPLKICACLGLLSDDDAVALKEAGVERYNHNVNTSRDHHASITSTHTYDDRVATVEAVKRAGISPCSGFIAGMGERDEQLVDVAFEGRDDLNPRRCLKILALLRLVCPTKEIRVAGGREVNLGSLQPLALYAANSIFIGDYLTTPGQAAESDYRMLADLGFEIEECAL